MPLGKSTRGIYNLSEQEKKNTVEGKYCVCTIKPQWKNEKCSIRKISESQKGFGACNAIDIGPRQFSFFTISISINQVMRLTTCRNRSIHLQLALAPYMPTIEHIFIHTYTIVIYFYTSNIHILLFFCRLFRFIVAPKGVRWFVVVLLSLASFCIYYTSNLHLQLTTIANKEKIIYLAWVLFPTFCCCWWYCCCFHTIIMIFLLRLCSVCIFNSFHFDLYYIFRILLGVFSDYRWSFVLWKKISNGEFHSEK